MPLERCRQDDKPGWRFGANGTCYVYAAGDDQAELAAKKKAVRQGLAIGGGKPPAEGFEEYADVLETVDLDRVEIIRAGGPYFGNGTAPGGAHFTPADLERIAADSNAVQRETKPPNKLGHSFSQALVKNSGLTDGEMPAIGWLTNFVADGKSLYADVKRVPKKVAQLIRVGAFRTRSPELSPWASRETGKSYPSVVRGLSWQGAKPVAITTLDDVVSLYTERPAAEVLMEAQAVVDDELVTVDFDPADAQAAEAYAEATRPTGSDEPADTSRQMLENENTIEFSDEQIAALREKLGLDESADADKLFEAVDALKAKAEQPAPPADPPSGDPPPAPSDPPPAEEGVVQMSADEVEELKSQAAQGAQAAEALRVRDRDDYLAKAMKDGKFDPAQLDTFRQQFDAAPETVRTLVDAIPEKTFEPLGSDDPGTQTAEEEQDEKMYREFAERTGLEVPA